MSRPDSITALLIEAIQARVDSLADAAPDTGHLLQGLAGVAIVDVKVSPSLTGRGINAAELRPLLARELLSAGVAMPIPHSGDNLGGIVASVDGLQAGDGSWAICLLLELKQRARLSRDPGTAFDATTWSGKLPSVSTTAELTGTCRELFRHLAHELGGILRSAGLDRSEAG